MKSIYFITQITFLFLLFHQNISSQTEITSDELSKHVHYLASDSLKGRLPGTQGFELAAHYVANEFKRYGLTLLGDNGFQKFNLKPIVKAGVNEFKSGINDFKFNKDFTVLSYSENAKIKSGVVFVGYGLYIQKDSLKWNDYSNANVKGKWVLIMRGHPEIEKSNSKFFDYGNDLDKVGIAKAKGAIGVILVSPPAMDKEDKLIPLNNERNSQRSGLPVIQVKRELTNLILANAGKTIDALEKDIDSTLKPITFDTKYKVEIKTEVIYIPVQTENVVAYLKGSDPALKSEYVVLGAHLDHLGFGGSGSGSRKPDTTAIHNGADDNTSGVATLLEIAQYLASKKDSIKRSILFIAFSAEELGLIGSQYYVNNPLLDLKNDIAMLNFDMVGRLNKNTRALTLSGTGTAKEWDSILNEYQKKSDLKFEYSKDGYGSSDHSSFYSRKIPVIHFFTGTHEDYHTPSDDADLIDYKGQEKVSKLASQLAFQLASQKKGLTFQESGSNNKESSRVNLKVTLGIMPGFGNDDIVGLKVEGVTKDKPAYKAGLQVGDIITALNDEKISNIYDYMDRLKKYKIGDQITITVKRGDKEMIFIVNF
jgi:aminopeptidase YwaD